MPRGIPIVDTNNSLILQERPIHITDERLNSILKEVYEQARSDERGSRWYDYYAVAWSMFTTLLLSLLPGLWTVDFQTKGAAVVIFIIECMIDLALLIAAVAMTVFRMNKKVMDAASERDDVVRKCIERHCNSAVKA